jgi:hypothetical protein
MVYITHRITYRNFCIAYRTFYIARRTNYITYKTFHLRNLNPTLGSKSVSPACGDSPLLAYVNANQHGFIFHKTDILISISARA